MKKCIVLLFLVIVVISVSNDECLVLLEIGAFPKNATGIEAFKIAYFDLTKRIVGYKKNDLLDKYYNELYITATDGFQERMLPSPRKWCNDTYEKDSLINSGFKRMASGTVIEFKSYEAFSYSYYNLNLENSGNRSLIARKYFEALYGAYENVLHEKKCKSPKDFCAEISPTGQTSMNPGYEHNQYTGKGASRQIFVPLDGEGQFVDLNLPYEDGNMNTNNDEDLGQIQNAEGSVNFDLKL